MAHRRGPNRFFATARIVAALSVLLPSTLLAEDVIHACVKKANGQVRIVPPAESCHPSEVAMQWSSGAPAGAGGSIMVHGGGFGSGGAPVNFVHLGGGIPVYRTPRAGTIQNTRILVSANTYNGATPVTLTVNGVATAIATVIPAGTTGDIDVAGTAAILDGDRISVILDRGASSSGSLELSVAYEIR